MNRKKKSVKVSKKIHIPDASNSAEAGLTAEFHASDLGLVVRVTSQPDPETKDVWISPKHARKLADWLIKIAEFIEVKKD